MLFFKPNVDRLKRNKDINGLISILSQNKDLNLKMKAADALADFNNTDVIRSLISELKNKDDFVRKHVTDALAKIGDDAVDSLTIAIKDKDIIVSKAAIYTLIKINNLSAIEILFYALINAVFEVREDAKNDLSRMSKSIEYNKVVLEEPIVKYLFTLLHANDYDTQKCAANLLTTQNLKFGSDVDGIMYRIVMLKLSKSDDKVEFYCNALIEIGTENESETVNLLINELSRNYLLIDFFLSGLNILSHFKTKESLNYLHNWINIDFLKDNLRIGDISKTFYAIVPNVINILTKWGDESTLIPLKELKQNMTFENIHRFELQGYYALLIDETIGSAIKVFQKEIVYDEMHTDIANEIAIYSVNEGDEYDRTTRIQKECLIGNIEGVRNLIKNGAKINVIATRSNRNESTESPVEAILKSNCYHTNGIDAYLQILELLINNGLIVDEKEMIGLILCVLQNKSINVNEDKIKIIDYLLNIFKFSKINA